jgi:hypothetical protein
MCGYAPSALYLLSAPSTPEEAVQEARAMAESGEVVTPGGRRDKRGETADVTTPARWCGSTLATAGDC